MIMLDILQFISEGLVIPVIAALGLIGNILAFLTLRSQKLDMKKTFRHILSMLAVFDFLFIVTFCAVFSLPLLSTKWKVRLICISLKTLNYILKGHFEQNPIL